MARETAQQRAQRRWRASTDKQRIEVYLPKDIVAALDEIAAERYASRALVIEGLTRAAREPAKPDKGYRLRKPKAADEPHHRKWAWLVMVEGEPIGGIKRDTGSGWYGQRLDSGFMGGYPCRKRRRDEVAQALVEHPEIYR